MRESLVASLELSKEMKDLGFAQKSEFYWMEEVLWSHEREGYYSNQFILTTKSYLESMVPEKSVYDTVGDNEFRNNRQYIKNTAVSAFLTGELGEFLPPSYEVIEVDEKTGKFYRVYLQMDKHPDQRPRGYRFRLRYRPEFNTSRIGFHNNEYRSNTEADARAKMLIHLAKEGIINPKELK